MGSIVRLDGLIPARVRSIRNRRDASPGFVTERKGRTVNNDEVSETPESRKAVFRRLVDIYASGDLTMLDELIAPHYVGHVSAGDRDLEGFRDSIKYFHNLFVYGKDSFQVEDQLVDGEKVATRMTARVQVRATGEHITLLGINIARIVGGQLVEEWNTWEQLQGAKPVDDAASVSWMPR